METHVSRILEFLAPTGGLGRSIAVFQSFPELEKEELWIHEGSASSPIELRERRARSSLPSTKHCKSLHKTSLLLLKAESCVS